MPKLILSRRLECHQEATNTHKFYEFELLEVVDPNFNVHNVLRCYSGRCGKTRVIQHEQTFNRYEQAYREIEVRTEQKRKKGYVSTGEIVSAPTLVSSKPKKGTEPVPTKTVPSPNNEVHYRALSDFATAVRCDVVGRPNELGAYLCKPVNGEPTALVYMTQDIQRRYDDYQQIKKKLDSVSATEEESTFNLMI